jgi:hypothetical protein
MSEDVKLLSSPTNYAVVQLAERRFPGVVIQGDSLHNLVQRLVRLQSLAEPYNDQELMDGITELRVQLEEAAKRYEVVCEQRGIALPYPKT